MSDTKAERLADALNDFLTSSPDVEAAAVVSFDGLAMVSALPPEMDEDRLGAMSAALLSLGEQAASGLGRGDLSQVFVEGEHGFVFLMSARDEAVLAAVTSKQAKIGFMLFEMRRAADTVGELLGQDQPDVRYEAFAEMALDTPAQAAAALTDPAPAEDVQHSASAAPPVDTTPEPHELLSALENGHGASHAPWS